MFRRQEMILSPLNIVRQERNIMLTSSLILPTFHPFIHSCTNLEFPNLASHAFNLYSMVACKTYETDLNNL